MTFFIEHFVKLNTVHIDHVYFLVKHRYCPERLSARSKASLNTFFGSNFSNKHLYTSRAFLHLCFLCLSSIIQSSNSSVRKWDVCSLGELFTAWISELITLSWKNKRIYRLQHMSLSIVNPLRLTKILCFFIHPIFCRTQYMWHCSLYDLNSVGNFHAW